MLGFIVAMTSSFIQWSSGRRQNQLPPVAASSLPAFRFLLHPSMQAGV
jgi:hypothetical protein